LTVIKHDSKVIRFNKLFSLNDARIKFDEISIQSATSQRSRRL